MVDENLVLPEFGVQSNTYGACLDGAKRDRYIWLGDFYHTTRIMGVANSKPEQITGTWQYLLSYQASNGQYPGLMTMTYETPMPTPEIFMFDAGTDNAYFNFPDYDILGLIGFVSYMEYYDDVEFAKTNWESFNKTVNWLVSCRGSDGLIDVTKYLVVFLGSGRDTAVNAAAVQCLQGMAKVAQAVGDEDSASQWVEVAGLIKTAINELLWNDTLGNYAVDVSTPEVYGVSATAFAITSGVANETQIGLCLKSLEKLRQGPGATIWTYRRGCFLDNLWDVMISDEKYRSGASWEYVGQSLEPGLEEYTSLSHHWGGAPTYALTNYVVGIRPVEFGFRRWIVNPLVTGLGLTNANATVRTPYGDLYAGWDFTSNDTLTMMITAPVGTKGVLEVAQLNANIYRQNINGTGEPIAFNVQL